MEACTGMKSTDLNIAFFSWLTASFVAAGIVNPNKRGTRNDIPTRSFCRRFRHDGCVSANLYTTKSESAKCVVIDDMVCLLSLVDSNKN